MIDKLISPQDLFDSVDKYFATAMMNISGESNVLVEQVARKVSAASREGRVCVHLGKEPAVLEGLSSDAIQVGVSTVISALKQSPLVGDGSTDTPLVLDDSGRVYLHRFWKTQEQLVRQIVQKATLDVSQTLPEDAVDRAMALALESDFLVITGGPGAGKTTLVATVLSSLIARNSEIRIGACAPTGKAAVRLKESIEKSRVSPILLERFPSSAVRLLPANVSTIHKLLSPVGGTRRFRYSHENQLPLDVLVVDEASMVDLQLMSALFDAMPRDGKIILLGDQHQLSSIEPGRVLGDICFGAQVKQSTENDKVARCIVTLSGSHRFGSDTPIGRLSAAVKAGDADSTIEAMADSQSTDITFVDMRASDARLKMTTLVETLFARGARAGGAEGKLQWLDAARVLCAVNHGAFGVDGLNFLAKSRLADLGLIDGDGDVYDSQPIIIPQNDYSVSLFNGDTGVICKEGGKWVACFRGDDGRTRKLPLSAIKRYMPAYATTIHKSQGSEFDHVVVVLPDKSPLLTRELLYTAITRARKKITIFATPQAIQYCVTHPTQREFALGYHLWGIEDGVE